MVRPERAMHHQPRATPWVTGISRQHALKGQKQIYRRECPDGQPRRTGIVLASSELVTVTCCRGCRIGDIPGYSNARLPVEICRGMVRPERAMHHQPRATPWVTGISRQHALKGQKQIYRRECPDGQPRRTGIVLASSELVTVTCCRGCRIGDIPGYSNARLPVEICRGMVRPERAMHHQPRATPWVTGISRQHALKGQKQIYRRECPDGQPKRTGLVLASSELVTVTCCRGCRIGDIPGYSNARLPVEECAMSPFA